LPDSLVDSAVLSSASLGYATRFELVCRRRQHVDAIRQIGRNGQPPLLASSGPSPRDPFEEAEFYELRPDLHHGDEAAFEVHGDRSVAGPDPRPVVVAVAGQAHCDGLESAAGYAALGRVALLAEVA
jgi:hypothetical protein